MIDLGGLKDKAQDLVADNADAIHGGIDKVGDFVGGKIGHDKVDGIEEKIHGVVDSLAGKSEDDAPAS